MNVAGAHNGPWTKAILCPHPASPHPPSLCPQMLGFLSQISERQPGALSASSAADSALLPLVAASRGGRRGWLPLTSLPLQPWLSALGLLPGAGPHRGHSQCGPDSFPRVHSPSICVPLGCFGPLNRPGWRAHQVGLREGSSPKLEVGRVRFSSQLRLQSAV